MTVFCSVQEIPYDHIWNRMTCHTVNSNLVLLRNLKETPLESLSFTVTISQGSFGHNNKKLAIKLSTSHLISVNNSAIMDSLGEGEVNEQDSGDNSRSASNESQSTIVFRLSNEIRQRMIEVFDKNHGKNWYHLAAMLKLDQFQTYFATKTSPTEHLLDLWEARHRDRQSLQQLVDTLKSLSQFEISKLIERELSQWLWMQNQSISNFCIIQI